MISQQTRPIPRAKLQLPKAPQRCAHPGSTCTRLAPGPQRPQGRQQTRACRGRFALRRRSERPGGTAPTPGRNRITRCPPVRRAPRPPRAAAPPARIPAPPPREPRAAPPLPAALRLSVPPRRAEVRGAGGGPASCRPRRGLRGRTRQPAGAGGGAVRRRSEPPRGSRPPRSGLPRRAALPCRVPLRPGPLVDVPVPSRTRSAMLLVSARRPHAVCSPAPFRSTRAAFSSCGSRRTGGPCARR